MAFSLKEDWPIIALAILAVVGLFLFVGGSSNASAAGAASGGISPADAASIEEAQNQAAAELQSQAQTNQAQLSGAAETGIFTTIGDLIQEEQANTAATLSNQTQQNADSLAAQVAEYQAYEQELSSEFGAATNMTTNTTVSNNELQALLAQYQLQQREAYMSSPNLFGIPGLGSLSSLAGLFG